MTGSTDSADIIARELRVSGQVQGRGVRPAVARLAGEHKLAGEVANTLGGILIRLEGDASAIARFERGLADVMPSGSVIERIDAAASAVSGVREFVIARAVDAGPPATSVPVDVGVCPDCLLETSTVGDRRFQYLLTTCAACGPRWTVIRSMPYERHQTSLADFPMCAECRGEYSEPRDRRYHAQTIGCPTCGPRVWGTDRQRRSVGEGVDAVEGAVTSLRRGEIVALRGIGGYQLLCDAADEAAVQTLRQRKRRPAKPLAVLVSCLQQADRLAFLSEAERKALTDPANPIVLCRSRRNGQLAGGVHGLLADVGLMLPTSPLHQRIAELFGEPLVCTSANREGEPLEYEIRNAVIRLDGFADFWLHHDRPIERPIDDSVVRIIADRPVAIRLARGLAPMPLPIACHRPLLAVGGHLKTACAWSNGVQAVLGPHIGDLDSLAARERFQTKLTDLQRLYGFLPQGWAHDLHPDYFTTRFVAEQSGRKLGIQHHLAHVAAGMLEHGLLDRTVLGVAWDGTGLGTDGTIWGGEFLRVEPNFAFQRVAHWRTFPLIGGEAAVREPLRVAVALLSDAIGREELSRARRPLAEPEWLDRTIRLSADSRFGVRTSSAGRLFDAAAALILGSRESRFDGEPAMLLEAIADPLETGSYPVGFRGGTGPAGAVGELDWRPLFAALWRDLMMETPPGVMACRFHRAMAGAVVEVCRRSGDLPIVLTGGVFQNRLLTELIVELGQGAMPLRFPGRIPPNDGGLAAGQLAAAARQSTMNEIDL